MNELKAIDAFNAELDPEAREVCNRLRSLIDDQLPEAESKIWHGHPVWFINGNPIVGYSRLKDSVRLMFWSGQSFESSGLTPTGSFKAAEKRYADVTDIDSDQLASWLNEALKIQWDYKNIRKRKGRLDRLS